VLFFALLGATAAGALAIAKWKPGFFGVLVVFVLALEIFAPAVAMLAVAGGKAMLPWWKVMGAALLSAGAIAATLSAREPEMRKGMMDTRWIRTTREGLAASLRASVTAVVALAVVELRTGARAGAITVLGSKLVSGASGAGRAAAGGAFGALAASLFCFIGICCAGAFEAAEPEESALFVALAVVLCFEVLIAALVTYLDTSVTGGFAWPQLIAAQLIGLAAMGYYLVTRHQELYHRLRVMQTDGEAGLAFAGAARSGPGSKPRPAVALRQRSRVICQETGNLAAIEIEGSYSASEQGAPVRSFAVVDCSRWPLRRNCARSCLAQAVPQH
jgi:hypothetical protein